MSIRRVRDLVMRDSALVICLSCYTTTTYRAGWRSCVWQLSGGAETILFLPGYALQPMRSDVSVDAMHRRHAVLEGERVTLTGVSGSVAAVL